MRVQECTYPAAESISCSILYLNCQVTTRLFETAFLAGLCSHADGAPLQFAGMALIWVSNTLTTADGNTGKANIAFCCICAAMTLAEMALFRGEMRRTKATKAR